MNILLMSLYNDPRLATFVDQYNHYRLHSAIRYIAPADKLHQREIEIFSQHWQKLVHARQQRKLFW